MNLNRNERLESFDITACPDMTAFFEKLVDQVWRKVNAQNRSQSLGIFKKLLDEDTAAKNPRRRNPFLDL